MVLRLARRLDVDLAAIDGDKGKRKQREDEEHYLLWLMLVPLNKLPMADDVGGCLTALSRAGFKPSSENRTYTVIPADITDSEYEFSTLPNLSSHLATDGGGVVLGGRGTGIAFVCDPKAVTRRETIRRTGLEDEVAFGEFAIWMPRPEPKGVTHDEAAAAILEVLPRIQNVLNSAVCFAVTTDDLAQLFIKWPCHRLLLQTGKLSELFWYQSYSWDLNASMLDAYRSTGCTIQVAKEGQIVIQLAELPSVGLPKLDAARDRWLYGLIPRRVC